MLDKKDLENLKSKAEKAIKNAQSVFELEKLYRQFLGKKGEVNQCIKMLSKATPEKRKEIGKRINEIKQFLQEILVKKRAFFQQEMIKKALSEERIDITAPGVKVERGHLHPLTLVEQRVEEIFQSMGFSVVLGPEVETEWYNFDALNIPKDHPARDMWDTFWLKGKEPETRKQKAKSERLLLRTHTSPVQIRYMEKHNPPLRIVVPGKCFRHEATDASHEFQFYQVEGLMVEERGKISVANFKAVIQEFVKKFFAGDIKMRLRPSYFPFTEPSFEVDIFWKSTKEWAEVIGAGMVHPKVFKAAGLNPKNWQGFAFGMGLDRLAMLKYNIPDIRLFHSVDLRFLKQF
ncbi:phenylalanine--tRNA ligase subunit alpha [bacterium]|nr:phenylalanine--tRNA ligase subunit alpha [bacterium]